LAKFQALFASDLLLLRRGGEKAQETIEIQNVRFVPSSRQSRMGFVVAGRGSDGWALQDKTG